VTNYVKFTRELRFLRDGKITGFNSQFESAWRYDDRKILLLSKSGEVTSEFSVTENYKAGFEGKSLKFNGVEFFIKPKKNWDIEQIKILVSVLKQQGIQHIVASSGTRDVSVLRLIERNSDFFKVYPVADERSAAYFAQGISLKIGKPVAIICTSGTAASNYLPGVTEAYYSKIPLIVITTDRHPMYLNNNDDQTIPQERIFDGVVKKSVRLSDGEHPRFEWFAEKQVKSTILEATHHTPGPVHINVPVQTLERHAPEDEDFKLYRLRNTRRVTRSDNEGEWKSYVEVLKKTKRIMVLYGQNQPISETFKRKIETFANKYNAVIVTEHLSNLQGNHIVNPYRAMSSTSQDEFNQKLRPDILISVGGTQIMNHPLVGKLRATNSEMRHWLVNNDGFYADKFYHLTSILECTQEYFFDYFVQNAGEIENDNVYYQSWLDKIKEIPLLADGGSDYTQSNVEGRLLKELPKESMLHLGVGNTFMMTQHFQLDSSIEVQVNMGTNGIDGSASTFMGQVAILPENQLAFLLIGDLSFFYDMNALYNKKLPKNIRIMMINNGKAGLLEHLKVASITQKHTAKAEGWVRDLGFDYLSSHNKTEFEENLAKFVSFESDSAIFFEVFI
jgi:2-succinyl-5-enolpyruvyl-6-hydroxy-3-cyclohexene-1-carboxylate synthase